MFFSRACLLLPLVCASWTFAVAGDLPVECRSKTIESIFVPASPTNPLPVTLRFDERIVNPDWPTVLFVPSGPGNRAIIPPSASLSFEQQYFLPSNVNVIILEYRGAGCNSDARAVLRDAEYSLVQAADDFLAVIGHLKRQHQLERYFLFGVGAGSAVARIMASRAQSAGVAQPQSVVYSAPVGRAWKRNIPFKATVIEQFELLKKELPSPALEVLTKGLRPDVLEKQNSPLKGFSKATWGNFFFSLIWPGWKHPTADKRIHPVLEFLEAVRTDDKEALRGYLDQLRAAERSSKTFGKIDNPMLRNALCRELLQTDDEQLLFHAGKLRHGAMGKYCAGIRMSHPYDAADWPIGVNQYVLQGARDPLMPKYQLDHLLDNSPGVETSVLIGTESGHGMTVFSLESCRESIWRLVLDYRRFSSADLTSCHAPFTVDNQRQY